MQETFLQVFIIVLGLLMHPNSDHYVEDLNGDLPGDFLERDQAESSENEKLNQKVHLNDNHSLQEQEIIDLEPTKSKTMEQINAKEEEAAKVETEKPTPKTSEADDCVWILWKTFSTISFIHFVWKCRQRHFPLKSNATEESLCLTECMASIDCRTLHIFHSRCVQTTSGKERREEEFLEGFVGDLLQSVKKICSEDGGMAIGTVDSEDLRRVLVPLAPPEPYFFTCSIQNKVDEASPDLQLCGHVEVVKDVQMQNGCPCQTSDLADEMVCLVHRPLKTEPRPLSDSILCEDDSNFLSKAEVSKWFQNTLRKAWSLIAFKYEFEVRIGDNMPGAVTVKFRSGEKMCFTIRPIIASDCLSYFFIPSHSPKHLDTFWSLSLSKYEDAFFDQISRLLPTNPCHTQTLEIMLFLHKRQTTLTGRSALKNVHFKIALMHLLLTKKSSEWRPAFLASRLKDLCHFLLHSLKTKTLNHALVGNPQIKDVIQLPADIAKSSPVNLFHPLVVHECIYKNATIHFSELLRNAQMLIDDRLCFKMQMT